MAARRGAINGRAWRLCCDHYAVRRRLTGVGHGLLDAILKERRSGMSLRGAIANIARHLRRLQREGRTS